jgi:hypothetical protein
MKRTRLAISLVAVVCVGGAMVEWSNRVALFTSAAEFDSYDTRDGKREAEADLAQGRAKWKVYGLYRGLEEDSARLKRLGIQVDWFAGCIGSEGIERYAYRYNSTIYSHHVALVGKEITEEVLGPAPVNPRLARDEGG